jgi:hypothetical protein
MDSLESASSGQSRLKKWIDFYVIMDTFYTGKGKSVKSLTLCNSADTA